MVYTLQTTRTGAQPASPIELNPRLLGPSKAERGAATNPFCTGGTPYNDLVHQGGTVMHSACISVPASDVGHLLIGVGVLDTKWFATK
jgi:hypothetical protein